MIKITQVQATTRHIRDDNYVMQTKIFVSIPKKTPTDERERFQESFDEIGNELEVAIKDVLVKNGMLEE